jgi:hypothetical protein
MSLAAEVYADLRQQVIQSKERRHNCSVAIDLVPWQGLPRTSGATMFTVTVSCEYRAVPSHRVMRFSCV